MQAELESILRYVGHERILSPLEWLEKLKNNSLKEDDLCLTFDDGLRCQKEIALPVLEYLNIKAFWFVYSSVFEGQYANLEIYRLFRTKFFDNINEFYDVFFDKALEAGFAERISCIMNEKAIDKQIQLFPFYSINDIKFRLVRDKVLGVRNYEMIMDSIIAEHNLYKTDLANNLWMSNKDLIYLNNTGHVLGLHSYSHPTVIADLSYEDQYEEYVRNSNHLKSICGINPVAMSHPCNSYDENSILILKELNIQCGFRSNMYPNTQRNRLYPSKYELPREDHANIIRSLQ